MDFIGIFVGAVFVLGVVSVVVVAKRRERERRIALLQEVAGQVSGRVLVGNWSRQPGLVLEHAGHPVRVEFYSTGGKNPVLYTRFILELTGRPDLRVHVYPEGFFSRIGKAFGVRDIQVGDALFDGGYMIKGNDAQRVSAFLSPSIREAIQEVRSLQRNSAVEVIAKDARLTVQKLNWLQAVDLLVHFIRASRQIADGYLRACTGEQEPVDTAGSPVCPVCEHGVDGSSQRCSRCDALHHPECWQLNGGCGRCGASV